MVGQENAKARQIIAPKLIQKFDKRRTKKSLQFNSAFAFSFHSTRSHSSPVWQCRDFPGAIKILPLQRIPMNEISSYCIDNRLRPSFFYVSTKVGKGRLSSNVERV